VILLAICNHPTHSLPRLPRRPVRSRGRAVSGMRASLRSGGSDILRDEARFRTSTSSSGHRRGARPLDRWDHLDMHCELFKYGVLLVVVTGVAGLVAFFTGIPLLRSPRSRVFLMRLVVTPVANFRNSCIDHHAEDGERGFEFATLILWRRGLLAGLGGPVLLGPVKSATFILRPRPAARPAWPVCPTRSTRGVDRVPFASLHWRTCASAA
jgi:hypothetical protein